MPRRIDRLPLFGTSERRTAVRTCVLMEHGSRHSRSRGRRLASALILVAEPSNCRPEAGAEAAAMAAPAQVRARADRSPPRRRPRRSLRQAARQGDRARPRLPLSADDATRIRDAFSAIAAGKVPDGQALKSGISAIRSARKLVEWERLRSRLWRCARIPRFLDETRPGPTAT